MTGGREKFDTLRNLFRAAECRRFRAKHRTNRWVEILGYGPDYVTLIGWWEGSNTLVFFDPEELSWTALVVYV